jgi:Major Facilitator Superfamily
MTASTGSTANTRWVALVLLCMGELMIVLDTTIVNVALPSIREDLGFTETSLAWVVNAYLLTFGGFLLLGGRLGDYFGHRRAFLIGVALFTLASLACGLAQVQWSLIAARAVQGFGGALVSAVSLSLIVSLFVEVARTTTSSAVGGGSRFFAEERSWRTAWRARSLLSWTTTSSHVAAPGLMATRKCASWPRIACAIACASMQQLGCGGVKLGGAPVASLVADGLCSVADRDIGDPSPDRKRRRAWCPKGQICRERELLNLGKI